MFRWLASLRVSRDPFNYSGVALTLHTLTGVISLRDYNKLKVEKAPLICVCAAVCTWAGGVGIAATQLCQTVQDVTVFGTASASKHETIAQGGVAHPIDYRTKDYVEEVRKISPKGKNKKTHTHTHESFFSTTPFNPPFLNPLSLQVWTLFSTHLVVQTPRKDSLC